MITSGKASYTKVSERTYITLSLQDERGVALEFRVAPEAAEQIAARIAAACVCAANAPEPAFDNGQGANGVYSMPADRSEERRRRIIDQVRLANSPQEFAEAITAACFYDPLLYSSLHITYGPRWRSYR